MATAIAAIRNAEHAFHATDRAADAGADRATDHAADRTGGAIAFAGALLGAADDALGMAELRHRQQRQSQARQRPTAVSWARSLGRKASVLTLVFMRSMSL